MGEYVNYKGTEVKIGTCESLYYVTYPKFKEAFEQGLLKPSEFSVHPAKCLEVDSGFLFRFPFPDEDKLPFGEIGKHNFNRGVPISIVPRGDKDLMDLGRKHGDQEFTINLIQQKFVRREGDGTPVMAAIFNDPTSGTTFRVEERADIQKIVGQIIRNNILNERDKHEKRLYSQVATRILKRYGLNPELIIRKYLIDAECIVKRSRKVDRGRGI